MATTMTREGKTIAKESKLGAVGKRERNTRGQCVHLSSAPFCHCSAGDFSTHTLAAQLFAVLLFCFQILLQKENGNEERKAQI